MGSTICVRCGANLRPHTYCNVCNDVLCFTCSSCSTNTDERIHVYCQNTDVINNFNSSSARIENKQNLIATTKSSQLILDNDHYANTHYYIQNQLNDEIKYNSINLSRSYWDNIFEWTKLVNRYWSKIFNIGIVNSTILYLK